MLNWYGGGEPHHMAELRRLFTTFGYLVANQGAVAVIGLAYWAVATHLFGPTEVGLSAERLRRRYSLGGRRRTRIHCFLWRKLNRSMPREQAAFSSQPEMPSLASWS